MRPTPRHAQHSGFVRVAAASCDKVRVLDGGQRGADVLFELGPQVVVATVIAGRNRGYPSAPALNPDEAVTSTHAMPIGRVGSACGQKVVVRAVLPDITAQIAHRIPSILDRPNNAVHPRPIARRQTDQPLELLVMELECIVLDLREFQSQRDAYLKATPPAPLTLIKRSHWQSRCCVTILLVVPTSHDLDVSISICCSGR